METRRILPASLAALLVLASALAAPGGTPQGGRPVRVEADYAVHEWGTFTSVIDPLGRTLRWNPFQFFAPLPGFVHRREELKPSFWGTVRMETPVLYFHAERPLSVDVRVGFPDGTLTEWYPEARAEERELTWSDVEVRPGLEAVLPTSLSGEHYYAARGVAAAHLRTRAGETEKFLFYRGVGSFEQPLLVRFLDGGQSLALENRGAEPIGEVLLFEKRAGRSGLVQLGRLASGETRLVERSALSLEADVSLAPLEELLRAHGLFEDEAQAMIATWRRDWFEPGLRVFYVLPRARTDALLPLAIRPAPDALERVLVGRLELIEPELEHSLLEAARTVAAGRDPGQAFAPLGERLTRFSLAVLQARHESEPELQAAEWQLVSWLEERSR